MKKYFLLFLTAFMVAMSANSRVTVCGTAPDENGNFSSQYIKSGAITWDEISHTLKLNNAVIEYSSDNHYDGVRTIQVTEDATIVIEGDCKVTNTGHVAFGFDSYNAKNIVITGNGSLYTSSIWVDIFLIDTNLTIKDIQLESENGIANNGNGVNIALAFENLQATIRGHVERIGKGITFKDCSITYPEDAYIAENEGYGYAIYYGNHSFPEKIIISRNQNSILGDVNNDGAVNIADLNAVIDMILRGNSDMRGDVNGDHVVNIADINAIISIILGGGSSQDDHEYVDLGLPSGTLWATCNVGASKPEDYGDYFAWGETAPKEVYSWETYKWCNNGSSDKITKYCTDSRYGYNGFTDGKTELEPQDDAAYVNWGSKWRTPTKEQQDELREQCTWTWMTQNGVEGRLVTGPNGKTIFLPASGFRKDDKLYDNGSYGHCWSRTSDFPLFAYYLYFTSPNVGSDRYLRYNGRPVRAVRVSQN